MNEFDDLIDDFAWALASLLKLAFYGLIFFGYYSLMSSGAKWLNEKRIFDHHYSVIVNHVPKQSEYPRESELMYSHDDIETTIILNYISGVKISDMDKLYLLKKCGLEGPFVKKYRYPTKEMLNAARNLFPDIEYCSAKHKAIWMMQKKYGDPLVRMELKIGGIAGDYNIVNNEIRLMPIILVCNDVYPIK